MRDSALLKTRFGPRTKRETRYARGSSHILRSIANPNKVNDFAVSTERVLSESLLYIVNQTRRVAINQSLFRACCSLLPTLECDVIEMYEY